MFGIDSMLWFVLLIGVMIFFHELGHFWAARYFDVKVDTFSIGFGPRLGGFRIGDTDFRVAAIPIGGYVKMLGQEIANEMAAPSADSEGLDPRSFAAKPRWQRFIIAFAGPFMNIILAVGILAGLYTFRFPKSPDTEPGLVGMVMNDSAAQKAGIREGDRIVAIGGQKNPSWDDILMKELTSANQALPVTVIRDGQEMNLSVTPKLDERNGIGLAGWAGPAEIYISELTPGMDAEKQGLKPGDVLVAVNGQPVRSMYRLSEIVRASAGKAVEVTYRRDGKERSVHVTPLEKEYEGKTRFMIGISMGHKVEYTSLSVPDAIVESVRQNQRNATLIIRFLEGLVGAKMSPKSVDGPIRIAQMAGAAAKQGAEPYLELMAGVSLNLAIFNLLPIPVLDGGLMLLLLIEMFIRRDLSLRLKETVLKFGLVFLMVVFVFVFYNDISKIFMRG